MSDSSLRCRLVRGDLSPAASTFEQSRSSRPSGLRFSRFRCCWRSPKSRLAQRRRVSFFASYPLLINDIKALFRRDRNAVYFLIASALYRDGLAAIFALARSWRSVSTDQPTVLIFGIAANVVAALGALGMGAVEDRIGPKRVIMISLIGLITTAMICCLLTAPRCFGSSVCS